MGRRLGQAPWNARDLAVWLRAVNGGVPALGRPRGFLHASCVAHVNRDSGILVPGSRGGNGGSMRSGGKEGVSAVRPLRDSWSLLLPQSR